MGTRFSELIFHGLLRAAHALSTGKSPQQPLDQNNVHSILAVSCTALGDALLSTPAIHSLRLGYPNARIVALVHPSLRRLFAGHPDIDVLMTFSGGWKDFLPVLLALRRLNIDLACILHGNEPQATPLAWLAGARHVFKLPNDSRFRFLLSNRDQVMRWEDMGHGADVRLACARLAGGANVPRRMTLGSAGSDATFANAWLAGQGVPADATLVAMHPGASTRSRCWRAERFAALADTLTRQSQKIWVIVTGSPAEAGLTASVAAPVLSERIIDAGGQIPIEALPALIGRCAIMICGDTGPMHLAVAVGTPVVALFAVSDHRRSGPCQDQERHVIIQKWRTCDPCLSKRCPYEHPLCMDNISVDEVAAAARRVLEESAT